MIKKRIAVVTSRFPYPLEKGDKLRAFQHIQQLNERGWDVTLIALSDRHVMTDELQVVSKFCSEIRIIRLYKFAILLNLISGFLKGLPFQVAYFYNIRINKKIVQIINIIKPDVIYFQLVRTALYSRHISGYPCVLDYQDAFSEGMRQRMFTTGYFSSLIYKREFKLLSEFEKKCRIWFLRCLIISEIDKRKIDDYENDNFLVLPNGVDLKFFNYTGVTSKSCDVLFVGNMNYAPNVDAAVFLVNKVMPYVWKVFPDIKVRLAGAQPHRKVSALASNRVAVTGWVNDIREEYKSARVFIAPMISGTGLQNKLLEAMAMKVPCISTSISGDPFGANAVDALLIGDSAEALSEHIISLLSDDHKAYITGEAGYNFVSRYYNFAELGLKLENVISSAVSDFNSKK
jgi:glycosyltransferase involved in cell wall biosynthesis